MAAVFDPVFDNILLDPFFWCFYHFLLFPAVVKGQGIVVLVPCIFPKSFAVHSPISITDSEELDEPRRVQ